LLAVLVVACASLAHAESEVDVAATLSARWGHWTLERLRWKREEIKSDLGQTHAEKARVKVWGNKVCQLVREIGQKSVLAAKESVSEWTDILKIRRDQRGYHVVVKEAMIVVTTTSPMALLVAETQRTRLLGARPTRKLATGGITRSTCTSSITSRL